MKDWDFRGGVGHQELSWKRGAYWAPKWTGQSACRPCVPTGRNGHLAMEGPQVPVPHSYPLLPPLPPDLSRVVFPPCTLTPATGSSSSLGCHLMFSCWKFKHPAVFTSPFSKPRPPARQGVGCGWVGSHASPSWEPSLHPLSSPWTSPAR